MWLRETVYTSAWHAIGCFRESKNRGPAPMVGAECVACELGVVVASVPTPLFSTDRRLRAHRRKNGTGTDEQLGR